MNTYLDVKLFELYYDWHKTTSRVWNDLHSKEMRNQLQIEHSMKKINKEYIVKQLILLNIVCYNFISYNIRTVFILTILSPELL